MSNPAPAARPCLADFPYVCPIALRWNDLDAYGHLNNARYYTFMDTVIMRYVASLEGYDPVQGEVVPYTVENGCRFFRSLGFPDIVDAALRVVHLGRTSVRYEVGLFRQGDPEICALGHFVDVFVERATSAPCPPPEAMRTHLSLIQRDAGG